MVSAMFYGKNIKNTEKKMERNIKTENNKNIKQLLEILCEEIEELKDHISLYERDPRKNA